MPSKSVVSRMEALMKKHVSLTVEGGKFKNWKEAEKAGKYDIMKLMVPSDMAELPDDEWEDDIEAELAEARGRGSPPPSPIRGDTAERDEDTPSASVIAALEEKLEGLRKHHEEAKASIGGGTEEAKDEESEDRDDIEILKLEKVKIALLAEELGEEYKLKIRRLESELEAERTSKSDTVAVLAEQRAKAAEELLSHAESDIAKREEENARLEKELKEEREKTKVDVGLIARIEKNIAENRKKFVAMEEEINKHRTELLKAEEEKNRIIAEKNNLASLTMAKHREVEDLMAKMADVEKIKIPELVRGEVLKEKLRSHSEFNAVKRGNLFNAASAAIDTMGDFATWDPKKPFSDIEQYAFEKRREKFETHMEAFTSTAGMNMGTALQSWIGEGDEGMKEIGGVFQNINNIFERERENKGKVPRVIERLRNMEDAPVVDDKPLDFSFLGPLGDIKEIKEMTEQLQERRNAKFREMKEAEEARRIDAFIGNLAGAVADVNDLAAVNKLEIVLANPEIKDLMEKNITLANIAKITQKVKGIGTQAANVSLENKLIAKSLKEAVEENDKLKKQITVMGDAPIPENKVKEGIDLKMQQLEMNFAEILGNVYAKKIPFAKGAERAAEQYAELDKARVWNATQERALGYQIKEYEKQINMLKVEVEKYEDQIRKFNAYNMGKVKLTEEEVMAGEAAARMHGKLLGDKFNLAKQLIETKHEFARIFSRGESIANMMGTYSNMFMQTNTPPRAIEYETTIRHDVFSGAKKIVEDLSSSGNALKFSSNQIRAMSETLRGLVYNMDKYDPGTMSETESSIYNAVKSTIESLSAIGEMSREERVRKYGRSTRKDVKPGPLARDKGPDYHEDKKSGMFAKKPQKEKENVAHAEALIRRIRTNDAKGVPTKITEQESKVINWYQEHYGWGSGVKLSGKERVTVTGNVNERGKEEIKKTMLEKNIQANLVKYAEAVGRGEIDPARSPVNDLLDTYLAKPPGRMEMEANTADKHKVAGFLNLVQAEIDKTILNMSRIHAGGVNPNAKHLGKLMDQFPAAARKALTDGYVLQAGKDVLEKAHVAHEEHAMEVIAAARNRAPEVMEKKEKKMNALYVDDIDSLEPSLEYLKEISDATPASEVSDDAASVLDGMMYDSYTGFAAEPKLFTNEQMYEEFTEGFKGKRIGKRLNAPGNRTDLLEADNILTSINTGLEKLGEGFDPDLTRTVSNDVHRLIKHIRKKAEEVEHYEFLASEDTTDEEAKMKRDILLDEIAYLKVDLELLDVERGIVSDEGTAFYPGTNPMNPRTVNYNTGIIAGNVLKKMALSAMFKFIKMNQVKNGVHF